MRTYGRRIWRSWADEGNEYKSWKPFCGEQMDLIIFLFFGGFYHTFALQSIGWILNNNVQNWIELNRIELKLKLHSD